MPESVLRIRQSFHLLLPLSELHLGDGYYNPGLLTSFCCHR